MIAIFGGAGTGKTTIAERLAALLNAPHTGPDDYRPAPTHIAWQRLLNDITHDHIVESCIAPPAYQQVIATTNALIVGVRCPSKTQARRLHARGWDQRQLRQALMYTPPVTPHVWVDGDGDTTQMAQAIRAALLETFPPDDLRNGGGGSRAHSVSRLAPQSQKSPRVGRPRGTGTVQTVPGSTVARGYGATHRALRGEVKREVEAGRAFCAKCHEWIPPDAPWDLGHDPLDRSRYIGPEHRRCNRDTRFEKSLRRPARHRVPAEVWL